MRFLYYRELSLREKAYLTLFCFVCNSVGSILLSQLVSKYFIAALFLGAFIFGGYLMYLKCPQCGTPIMKNELHVFGLNTHMWLPKPVRKCTNCGCNIG